MIEIGQGIELGQGVEMGTVSALKEQIWPATLNK